MASQSQLLETLPHLKLPALSRYSSQIPALSIRPYVNKKNILISSS